MNKSCGYPISDRLSTPSEYDRPRLGPRREPSGFDLRPRARLWGTVVLIVLQSALRKSTFLCLEGPYGHERRTQRTPDLDAPAGADIAMIDRAAGLRGRSRTDFARTRPFAPPRTFSWKQADSLMSPEGFADFMAVLSGPATSVPEIVDSANVRPPGSQATPRS